MKKIKLVAVDIDGVLLEDTFSPVLYRLVNKYGVDYTKELENNIFSQNRKKAATYLKNLLSDSKDLTTEQIIEMYFMEREKYIKENKSSRILDGAIKFIQYLKKQDINIVCYGGLPRHKIVKEFIPFLDCFDRYICTNNFRPGLKEIIRDKYHLNFDEALFIDDVNNVAMEAKRYNISFIGVPSNHMWGFQKSQMINNEVKYIVDSVKDITPSYFNKVMLDDHIWRNINSD